MIYTIILLTIVMFSPLSRIKITENNIDYSWKNTKTFAIAISLILISILGFRNINVGIDTLGYFEAFIRVKSLSLTNLFDDVYYEYGYRILQYTVSLFIGEYQFLLILVAIFYVASVSFHIHKHSTNPAFSYILFILYGFYTFAFSATRQALAIAVVLIAYEFIIKNKKYKFLMTIVIAASFHVTSVIFFISYLVTKVKLNKFTITALSFLILITVYFKEDIFVFLNGLSRVEYNVTDTGGDLLFLFMIISVLLGVLLKKSFLESNPKNKSLFYMMCLGVIIMPITTFHPAIMRLFYYFFIFLISYVPNVLNSIKNPYTRLCGYFFYFSIGIFFFYTNVIPNARLENYSFFWE